MLSVPAMKLSSLHISSYLPHNHPVEQVGLLSPAAVKNLGYDRVTCASGRSYTKSWKRQEQVFLCLLYFGRMDSWGLILGDLVDVHRAWVSFEVQLGSKGLKQEKGHGLIYTFKSV